MTTPETEPVLLLDEQQIEGMTAAEMHDALWNARYNASLTNIRFEYHDSHPAPEEPPVPVIMLVADRLVKQETKP